MAETTQTPSTAQRGGARLKDRTEYRSKPRPLTGRASDPVVGAVHKMAEKRYGCIIVVDDDGKIEGIVTERDVMTKIVGGKMDPEKTTLGDIMTEEPRVAREDDLMLDWLRIMSNERFRRLPVVDDEGRPKALFTQGDFVSYTWPDLAEQAKNLAKATMASNFPWLLVGGAVLIYALGTLVVVGLR